MGTCTWPLMNTSRPYSGNLATDLLYFVMQCIVPPGLGSNLPVSVSVNNGVAVRLSALNYTQPVLQNLSPGVSTVNITAGSTVTVLGRGFGASDSSPRSRVGLSVCAETRWVSESSLTCKVAAGTGVQLSITTTIALAEVHLPRAANYSLPTLVSAVPNGSAISLPTTGGGPQITVTGSDFGTESNPPGYLIRVGQMLCSKTFWDSPTQLRCEVPPGVGKDLPISVVAPGGAAVTLTGNPLYKYEAPVISALSSPSGPAGGGVNLTVFGKNFGGQDVTGQLGVRIGATLCPKTYWISDTAINCNLPKGALANLRVTAEVGGQTSAPLDNAFGFISPSCSAIVNMEPNAPSGEYYIDPLGDGDVFKVQCNADLERAGIYGRLGNLTELPTLWLDASVGSDITTSDAQGNTEVSSSDWCAMAQILD
jgi:hypothetical protein